MLKLLQQDFTTSEICDILQVGTKAVEGQRLKIYQALNAKTASGAIVAGFKNGLLSFLKDGPPVRSLSFREIAILELVIEDLTTAEICMVLDFKKGTVVQNYSGIYEALGTRTMPGSVSKVLSLGILRL